MVAEQKYFECDLNFSEAPYAFTEMHYDYVFVNGVPVIKDGSLMDKARSGKAITVKAKVWKL